MAAGKTAINLLAGGSVIEFGDNEKHIVFPPESFRTDSFNVSGHPIDFAPAIGISYDVDIDSAYRDIRYLFHSVSLGINAYYNQTSRDGIVLQYGLPDFANSTYNMKVSSSRLMLDTELDFRPLWEGIMLFIEVGAGAARNTLSFENNPLPNVGADGGFYSLSKNPQIQFAYEAGAGIKVPICHNLVLSARYLYANSGNAESSKYDYSTGVTLGKPIKVKIESQSVLVGLSYLFG
ncbi:outer membrane protein [Aquicella lusitana]|uniref:outer membrane protein n=1 Tax=Aquicella lusitana TaxID=254246 RepID=UPI0011C0322B|nr:hypothetical protein [Aquicella lusitana]